LLLVPTLAHAQQTTNANHTPGSEVVMVLDTSCSMAVRFGDDTGRTFPPNDPQRVADLGALMVMGLAQNSEDKVTLIGFGSTPDAAPPIATTPDQVRALPYVGGTFFRKPLQEARRILESSTREHRMLLFFTDGAPDDVHNPAECAALVGNDQTHPFDRLIIGLYGSPEAKESGEAFLAPLATSPEQLVFVDKPSAVVSAFTNGFAKSLGARPETGTLQPGQSKQIAVSKYVLEVLITTAQVNPGAPYTVKLEGPKGNVPIQSQGDNGCPTQNQLRQVAAGNLCAPPRRHYATFRAPSDPTAASTWTLSLPQSPGPVDYGIILRYDLNASLSATSEVRVGQPVQLEAKLLFRGQAFDDPGFYTSDNFSAVVHVGGQEVKLEHAGGGRFVGTWTPTRASANETATVTFKNNWMEKQGSTQIAVGDFLDLTLRPTPNPIELGSWRGERGGTRRCAVVDLSGSTNADKIPIQCAPLGSPAQGALTCQPVAGSEANLGGQKGQPLKYEVCLGAQGCCNELVPDANSAVRFVGQDPHYADGAATVPVRFHVEAAGWLRCWWWLLALIGALLFAIWFIAGWVRPYNFDAASCLRVSGSEQGLKRASALVLRELPGGVRGFYRNARVALNASGDFVRNVRMAVLVLEAGPGFSHQITRGAGLERKDRHGKWEPVPQSEWSQGLAPNVVYRLGSLHVKFG
jgi:hypothetical protein